MSEDPTPYTTMLRSPKQPGRQAAAGMLPPLKTRVNMRLSDESMTALLCIRKKMKCGQTAAVELALARLAAFISGDVCTPQGDSER